MSQLDKEMLRTTHLSEYEGLKDRQRHGFFSVPASTALGDDGPYKAKIRMRVYIQIHETKWGNQKPRPGISRPIRRDQVNLPNPISVL
jgi:hypothetical protein